MYVNPNDKLARLLAGQPLDEQPIPLPPAFPMRPAPALPVQVVPPVSPAPALPSGGAGSDVALYGAGDDTAPPPPPVRPTPSPISRGIGTEKMITAPPPPRTGVYQAEADVRKYGTPINRSDPRFRPRWWEYIAGIGLGTMAGMGGNGRAARDTAEAIVNRRYNRAEEMRLMNLNTAEKILGQENKNWAANTDLYKTSLSQGYRDEMQDERERHNRELEGVRRESADIRRELGEARDPEVMELARMRGREKIADRMKLKGATRTNYILYGTRDPQGLSSRVPTDLEMWADAFRGDNGREPSAQEIADRKWHGGQASSAQFEGITDQRDKALKAAEKDYSDDYEKYVAPLFEQARVASEKDKAAATAAAEEADNRLKARLEKAKAAAVGNYQQRVGEAAQRGQRAQAAPTAGAKYRVGQKVKVRGRWITIKKVYADGSFE